MSQLALVESLASRVASPPVSQALAGTVAARVYHAVAPADAVLPYAVFTLADAARERFFARAADASLRVNMVVRSDADAGPAMLLAACDALTQACDGITLHVPGAARVVLTHDAWDAPQRDGHALTRAGRWRVMLVAR